ncbi:MAG: Ig-like domain repeat protein, partial [Actinomycetia bacterium]|nr:Ig-like domain repeat protein [Actinomycetes bacterium]
VRFLVIDPADLPAVKAAAASASPTGTPQDPVTLTQPPTPVTSSAKLLKASDSSDTGVLAAIFDGAPTDGTGTAQTFGYSLVVYDYTQWGNTLYSVMLDKLRYFCGSCDYGGGPGEVHTTPGYMYFLTSNGAMTTIRFDVPNTPGTPGTAPLAVTSQLTTDAYTSFTDGTHTAYYAALGDYDLYWLDGTAVGNLVVVGSWSYSVDGVPLPDFDPATFASIPNGTFTLPDTSLVGGWVTGDPVTLRAAVSDNSGHSITPSGSVTFIMTNTDTGTVSRLNANLDSSGVATTTWAPDIPGHYSITAQYTGSATSAASTSQPGSYYAYINHGSLELAGGTSMKVGESMDLAPILTTTIAGVPGQPRPVQVTYTVTRDTQDMSSSGLIVNDVFTPLRYGTYTIAAQYADAAGSYTATKSVVVIEVPMITTTSLRDANVDINSFMSPYSATLAATGTTPITWALTSGVLPDDWSLDASTGVISGFATAAGTYHIGVTATNRFGSDTKLLTLSLVAASAWPGVVGPTTMTLTEGYPPGQATAPYTFTGNPSVVDFTGMTGGLTWNDSTKCIEVDDGLPVGTYWGMIYAEDDAGQGMGVYFTLTVTSAPVAPGIGGPTSVTLLAGYDTTSTNTFKVYGTDPVVVTMTGDPKIAWNDTTKRLDIAPGLAVGSYPVQLTASNGVSPDATLDFTLTVAESLTPTITGPTGMILRAGYAATTSDAFVVSGPPPVTVTKTAGDAKITWNGTTKKLDIAAGLAPGTYPVTLTASNGAPPDAVVTFTLTVTGVVVSPPSAALWPGSSQQFTAVVTGVNVVPQAVTWRVSGATSPSTSITPDGLLAIGADETASAVTVTATSTIDTTLSGSSPVTIVPSTTQFTVTLSAGSGASGSGSYAVGTMVSIGVGTPPAGLKFKAWTSGDVTLADSSSASTTFTMPARNVIVVATWVATAPVITTTSLPDSAPEVPYQASLAATGDTPITWSLVGGALPDGFTLSPDGVISGTPQWGATSPVGTY